MKNTIRETKQQSSILRVINAISVIELVIVFVLLSLLSTIIITWYLGFSDQVEGATIKGVAQEFATGLRIVREEWELEARPRENSDKNQSYVTLDEIQVGIDKNTGHPTGQLSNDVSSEDDAISGLDCESIFILIMKNAPTITSNWGNTQSKSYDYFTTSIKGAGSGGSDLCFYYLSKSIRGATAMPSGDAIGAGFIYDPRLGQVVVFNYTSA